MESNTHHQVSLGHKHQSSKTKELQARGSHPAESWGPLGGRPSLGLLCTLVPSQAADSCQRDAEPADSDY